VWFKGLFPNCLFFFTPWLLFSLRRGGLSVFLCPLPSHPFLTFAALVLSGNVRLRFLVPTTLSYQTLLLTGRKTSSGLTDLFPLLQNFPPPFDCNQPVFFLLLLSPLMRFSTARCQLSDARKRLDLKTTSFPVAWYASGPPLPFCSDV